MEVIVVENGGVENDYRRRFSGMKDEVNRIQRKIRRMRKWDN